MLALALGCKPARMALAVGSDTENGKDELVFVIPMLSVAVTTTTTEPMNDIVTFATTLVLLVGDWYRATAITVSRHARM